jgi:uncharacterized protein (TIGR03118 family)
MFLRHTLKLRARSRLSLLLMCALALSVLPIFPAPAARASGARRDDAGSQQIQSIQIPSIPPGQAYRQANLISDIPGFALVLDPLLVNPWGITSTSSSPFWVANNGTSTTQLLRGDVSGSPFFFQTAMPTVNIPGGLPTGTVANSTSDFVLPGACASAPCVARFLFASITGNITGWNPNAPAAGSITAVTAASHPGHVYTGLAIGSNSGGNRLYAADFANGNIDVYDGTFALTTTTGGFVDPTIPNTTGNVFHPYNIQNIGGSLYVAYAKVGADGKPESGIGNGFVRRFNTDGVRDLTFGINNGPLNSPWGLTIAPATFGIFGGALLVGNFGEGNPSIHAFNATTGAFLGTLNDESGNGIEIDELWGLSFGNGAATDANTLYFNAGTAEEEHGLMGSLKPTTATATSLIQFASDTVAIGEGSGGISITVTRSGDVSGSATVNYTTFDESQPAHASQKSDYELATGILRFAPGETSKTFRIPLVNDLFVEGDEEVNLALSNPTGTGVGLGSPNTAELTILDDDTTPPTTNPIDNTQFFVRQHYLDFLNREPDTGGFNAWVNTINNCPSGNTTCDRVSVSSKFFLSDEFQARGYFATRFYKAAFNRDPLYGEFIGDLSRLTGATPDESAALKTTFVNDFVTRPEFRATLDALTNAQYVDKLIANTGVTFTTAQRDQFVADLNSSAKTRAQVLRDIVEAPQFAGNQTTFNRAFVLAEYFGYLRRDPDTAGFNMWIAFLAANPGDFRTMVNGFVNSAEYRQRFGAS